jgi:uncharacterized membrane protein (DUF485 family)
MSHKSGPEGARSLEPADWNAIASSPAFQQLLTAKRKFVLPVFLIFGAFYLLLHLSVGLAPRFMSTRVFGTVTLAYLLALSQFVSGGIVAVLYLRFSARLDVAIEKMLRDLRSRRGEN